MHYILISFILHTQCTRPVNTLDDVVFEQLVTCTQQTQFWCKEARALSPRHIGNGQLGTPALCVCVLYSHYRVKIQLCEVVRGCLPWYGFPNAKQPWHSKIIELADVIA